MMDLIDRNTALQAKPEHLNSSVERITKELTLADRSYARGWNACTERWLKEIASLPSAQPEQQWIPCSEKLPEKEGRYLVTVNKGNEKCVEDDFFYFRYFTKDGTPSWYLGEDVVAWMPIPEPYKSEVEGRIDE